MVDETWQSLKPLLYSSLSGLAVISHLPSHMVDRFRMGKSYEDRDNFTYAHSVSLELVILCPVGYSA